MTKEEILKWLKEHNAFKGNNISSGITTVIKNHFPSFLEEVSNIVGIKITSISQGIYHLTHEDASNICPVCGKERPFEYYCTGYRATCGSRDCVNISTQNKMKETCLERYGVEHPAQSEQILKKMKDTCLERYGVDNYSKTSQFITKSKETFLEKYGVDNPNKSKEILDKRRDTCLERYGVEHPSQMQEIKDKHAKTNLERYGVTCNLHSEEGKEKVRQTSLERYGVEHFSQAEEIKQRTAQGRLREHIKRYLESEAVKKLAEPLFTLEEYKGTDQKYLFKCNKCGTVFENEVYNNTLPLCPTCNPKPIGASREEKEIVAEIRSFYDGIVLENVRNVISPRELDIWIPEKKVAIEFNGCYYHSEQCHYDPKRSLEKSIACEKKGIHLIQIFEDEWRFKKDIVLDIIKASLGIYNVKIGARECALSNTSKNKNIKAFLNENHLQGASNASISYSLFYNNEIVATMTFSKIRFGKCADYELQRYAIKSGYSIIGAFERLLKAFREENSGTIVTYSERRLFSGSVYRNHGFEELKPTSPDYWYVSAGSCIRQTRESFQKHKLVKKYGEQYKDWTEHEIANYFKFYRIYGCGNWKFILY